MLNVDVNALTTKIIKIVNNISVLFILHQALYFLLQFILFVEESVGEICYLNRYSIVMDFKYPTWTLPNVLHLF